MGLLGIIADPQYASDVDDGGTEGRTQRYRAALSKTSAALSAMSTAKCTAIVQLGDIIQSDKTQSTHQILDDLAAILEPFDLAATTTPCFHTLGNHCISRLSRAFVCEKLNIEGTTEQPPPSMLSRIARMACVLGGPDPPPAQTSYYAQPLSPNWKLIVLDTTELSGHNGYAPDSQPAIESAAYLAAHPLSETDPHMIPWNGGCTKRQLQWLQKELRRARRANQLVVVASHHPIHPQSGRPTHLAWNWKEIFKAVNACPNVRLVLSGHDHLGGGCRLTAKPRSAIAQLYITVPAILEAGECDNEYLIVDLDELARITDARRSQTRDTSEGSSERRLAQWGGEKSEQIVRRVFYGTR